MSTRADPRRKFKIYSKEETSPSLPLPVSHSVPTTPTFQSPQNTIPYPSFSPTFRFRGRSQKLGLGVKCSLTWQMTEVSIQCNFAVTVTYIWDDLCNSDLRCIKSFIGEAITPSILFLWSPDFLSSRVFHALFAPVVGSAVNCPPSGCADDFQSNSMVKFEHSVQFNTTKFCS